MNLDALQLFRADCVFETNFYTTLKVQTLTPLTIAVFIFLLNVISSYMFKDSKEKRMKYRDVYYTSFLTLTYLVFASVSTTVFDTFNCITVSDDENHYLARDHSVICGTKDHGWYKAFAGFMIVVYPVGIPAFYFLILLRLKDRITAKERHFDPTINKVAFLWENYEPEMWWWEVFECARRLGLSGVLVFVDQGSISQILVALLISVFSSALYIHMRPFEREDDDNLMIVTQGSLFFTLLAAILRKVKVDITEGYNQTIFGGLLGEIEQK